MNLERIASSFMLSSGVRSPLISLARYIAWISV
jgi:hypothetical protein